MSNNLTSHPVAGQVNGGANIDPAKVPNLTPCQKFLIGSAVGSGGQGIVSDCQLVVHYFVALRANCSQIAHSLPWLGTPLTHILHYAFSTLFSPISPTLHTSRFVVPSFPPFPFFPFCPFILH